MKLNGLLVRELIEPGTTINTSLKTEAIDISNREAAFSVQFVYDNGTSVDFIISLELSTDGINFAEVPSTIQGLTTDSGSHLWDIADSGARYLRVSVVVNAGSMDVQRSIYSGRRRH